MSVMRACTRLTLRTMRKLMFCSLLKRSIAKRIEHLGSCRNGGFRWVLSQEENAKVLRRRYAIHSFHIRRCLDLDDPHCAWLFVERVVLSMHSLPEATFVVRRAQMLGYKQSYLRRKMTSEHGRHQPHEYWPRNVVQRYVEDYIKSFLGKNSSVEALGDSSRFDTIGKLLPAFCHRPKIDHAPMLNVSIEDFFRRERGSDVPGKVCQIGFFQMLFNDAEPNEPPRWRLIDLQKG